MTRSCVVLLWLPALLIAGTVTHTATFGSADLSFSKYQGYDVVESDRGIIAANPGQPALPEFPLTLVVPAGADVKGVSVTPLASSNLPGSYSIIPAQPARPISKPHAGPMTAPDPVIYSQASFFPGVFARPHVSGSAAGFRLVSLSLLPLQYEPQSGRLTLHTRVQVTVEYAEGVAPVLTPAQRDRAAASLVSLVANASDLDRFGPVALESDLPEIAHLIITSDALAPYWHDFADYRSARGLRSEIRTTEWIDRNYPGRDVQEKTRNLIIDFYQHRGLSYVLLAGDNAQVPCRRIRLSVFDETSDIPTDLYFGDLDYSWDSNHNNLFGEMTDSVDLYADVLVGRASCDNQRQVANFGRKVAIFETDPAPDYIKRSLLPSGWLWRSIGYHGKFVCDSIANLTPAPWVDRKLENPRNSAVVADSFDHGFSIFNPSGHGNSGGVYDENGTPIYLTSNAGNQHNYRRYAIMTSLACDPGDFEAEDCVAEVALNCDTAGCIGVMMNSRYGWGTPPAMGPSEKLCVRYFDYFLTHDQFVMGACHDRSREVYSATARYDALWRWCMTEFNLFGDPAIDVWSETPANLSIDAPPSIPTGIQTLNLTARRNGVPISDACVTAWKDGEVCATAQSNGGGNVALPVHALTTGTITVTATLHNCLPGSAGVEVIAGAPEPNIVHAGHSIDDAGAANPNGILEPGETGVLSLTIRNAGTANATNTRVVLRPVTPNVTAPDSTAPYGTVLVGAEATSSELSIAAGPSVFPGSTLEIVAAVTSDQGSSEFVFGVDVGYPGRVTAEIDTGICALTITARGSLGFDETPRKGRGFRFPKTDTSMLNTACLALATGPDWVADRFYTRAEALDNDWTLSDSVRSRVALWNGDEMLTAAFADDGHPDPKDIWVNERAIGLGEPELAGAVVLVYDIYNTGAQSLDAAYAGILANFDVKATDRFHDLAYTLPGLNAALMRCVILTDRFCGVKLLAGAPAHLTCIDHGRYVNPDSAMTESMKYRCLTGELGLPQSDRPFNWSVSVAAGPFSIAPQEYRRLAFAFVADDDSVGFVNTCIAVQQWYDLNVGLAEQSTISNLQSPISLSVSPSVTSGLLRLQLNPGILESSTPAVLRLYSSSGRLVLALPCLPSADYRLPSSLPSGVYMLKLQTPTASVTRRITLVR